MANYDQMAAAVSMLSGGKNVVLLDDANLPSVYVIVNKFNNSWVIDGASENVHMAFNVDGAIKNKFYYSKYQNVIINNRAYSLPSRDPKTSINFDAAKKACDSKGTGFHLSTMAEWTAIALLSKANGTMPHGNNQFGRDHGYPYETGLEASHEGSGDTYKINRCFTGSGPATWGHDHTVFGIQDLNGNIWEWNSGLRLMNGEIQVIAYNNAAMGSKCDQSPSSTLWRGIKADGTLVDPGTANTLKYDWVGNKINLTKDAVTFKEDKGVGCSFKDIIRPSVGLCEYAAELTLAVHQNHESDDYGGDNRWFNLVGERLPLCGGAWNYGANAGVFVVDLDYPRSHASGVFGFRSAYVDL